MTAAAIKDPLAIICGGGALPFAVADAVLAHGRRVVMFALEGAADRERVGRYPHHWVGFTQSGKLLAGLQREGCREVVLVGSLSRPPWWKFLLSGRTFLLVPTIVSGLRGGDNHLLSVVARIGERHGFRIVAPHEIAPEILVGAGDLTRRTADANERANVARGLALLRAMGPYDVGQGAVVIDRHIVAVEGIEGTDAMLARVAALRREGRITSAKGKGVLVKAPKPDQDRRFDLPAIGPKTVEAAAAAGLAGIAVAAGGTVIADPAELIAAADRADLFVTGVEAAA